MKRFTIAMMALVFAMGMPMIATAAMDHGSQDKEMAGDMKHDMSAMEGGFVEIGKDTQNGVVATIKLKTYDDKTLASMKKMGMDATHHVMIFFADEKSGDEIAGGKVALKVKGQDAKPTMMMLMGKGFGADVSLSGMVITFDIGTKLEDGQKRQFSIEFHNM
jgi:hypothetical protein